MKRIGLIIVFLAGLLVAFPSSGATSNVVRFVATNSCNSFQANAVLQGQIHGVWSDVSPVAGWLPSGNCPDNFGVPWTMANIAAGTKIRWHIFPSDNSWVFYTPTQTAPLSSCSPKGTTLTANGRLYTCVTSAKKLIWNSGVTAPTTTTTLYAPFNVPTLSALGPATACKLPYTGPLGDGKSNGFPMQEHRVPSTGNVKVLLAFIDFPDDPASSADIAKNSALYQQVTTFYKSVSYGKLNLQITTYPQILHIKTNSTAYGMGSTNTQGLGEIQLWKDSAEAALAAGVDFTGYSSVYFLVPSDTTTIVDGATISFQTPIDPNVPNIYNGVAGTSNTQGHSQPWIWFAHELSLNMGLEEPWAVNYGNPWGIEGAGGENNVGDGSTPYPNGIEILGYNRWLLSWISDAQVACIDAVANPTSTATYDLTPIEAQDSATKIAVIKVAATKLIVIEYRANAGYDNMPLSDTGALVYSVDTSINSEINRFQLGPNSIAAYVPLGTKTDSGWVISTISTGETIKYQGVTISVVGMNANNLYVKVTTTPSS